MRGQDFTESVELELKKPKNLFLCIPSLWEQCIGGYLSQTYIQQEVSLS